MCIRDRECYRQVVQKGALETTYEPENVFLFGRSLGCAVCIHVASLFAVGGLILFGPFTCIKDIAKLKASFLGPLVMPDVFRSIDKIENVKAPIVISHGSVDTLIPLDHSKRLLERHKGDNFLHVVEGLGHYPELKDTERAFLAPMREFFDKYFAKSNLVLVREEVIIDEDHDEEKKENK
eukprot:TRINITY_DN12706_c0_g1_i1.p1 TRINITY_DN12706_c0_g1~~TRINITY_DN12706_c0_g1_i1.p1  ORF type:complete len:200 (-),score=51.37 TRINITY_DN12706_c0_g1_i1:137-676(-)